MSQTNISTFRQYNLTKEVAVSTGYIGRGIQPLQKTLPVGTQVLLTITKYTGAYIAHDGEVYTHLQYTVSKNIDGVLYGASEMVPVAKTERV